MTFHLTHIMAENKIKSVTFELVNNVLHLRIEALDENHNNFIRLQNQLDLLLLIPEEYWKSRELHVLRIPLPGLKIRSVGVQSGPIPAQRIKNVEVITPFLDEDPFLLSVVCESEDDLRILLNGLELEEDSEIIGWGSKGVSFRLNPTEEGLRKWSLAKSEAEEYRRKLSEAGW